jgi:hypothetical protein
MAYREQDVIELRGVWRRSDPCGEGPSSPDGAAGCGAPLRETVRSATWLPSFKVRHGFWGCPIRDSSPPFA